MFYYQHMGVRDFDRNHFQWPTTVAEVCDLVHKTLGAGGKLRVRGSQHSDLPAVYTDGFSPTAGPPPSDARTNLILDGLRKVTIEAGLLVVETGRHIGADPYGEPPVNDEAESLVGTLNALGLALPALGGISHQALAGFLSTGSAGGSTWHDPAEAIAWLELVDGTGTVRKLQRGDPDFDAAIVSLGLFGVLTRVAFSLDPASAPALPARYDVAMTSRVCKLADWTEDGQPFDPYAPGALERFFREKEYARVLWWPQPMVEKVQVWTGARRPHDPTAKRVAYENLAGWQQTVAGFIYRHVLGTGIDLSGAHDGAPASHARLEGILAQLAGHAGLAEGVTKLAAARALPFLLPPGSPPDAARQLGLLTGALTSQLERQHAEATALGVTATLKEHLVAALINLFIQDEWRPALYDDWHKGLPHDNQIDDDKMPVVFTELWIPLSRADEVMLTLRELFARSRLAATGTLCVEIYPAKKRAAWLSPSHGEHVVRVDPFVFWVDDETRREAIEHFFPQYWKALAKFHYRNHWGKVLDPDPKAVAQREGAFQRLAEFRELRKQYDPNGIFLNDYWRDRLGIR